MSNFKTFGNIKCPFFFRTITSFQKIAFRQLHPNLTKQELKILFAHCRFGLALEVEKVRNKLGVHYHID